MDAEQDFSSNGQKMTDKQIRDVITPYEFGVSDHLIGTALARPKRRGFAMLLDMLFVSMLTGLPSILLAGVGAVVFWRAGNKKEIKPRFNWLRKTLRFIAAFLLFGVLIAVFEESKPSSWNDDGPKDVKGMTGLQGIATAGMMIQHSNQMEAIEQRIAAGACEPYACWEGYITVFSTTLGELGLEDKFSNEILQDMQTNMQKHLSDEQTATLLAKAKETLKQHSAKSQPLAEKTDKPAADKQDNSFQIPKNDDGDPSLLAWVRGLLEDLGIGFGWAALYFTAFTYWFKGQTPGKKIMGIKVIKLDGNTMTLWESFERYGGYGAGLATGLLGFLQIYWEPNRMAIQDKISETLVIRLGMDKLDVHAINESQRALKSESKPE